MLISGLTFILGSYISGNEVVTLHVKDMVRLDTKRNTYQAGLNINAYV